MKKSCSTWLAVYAVVAIGVGWLVYHRFPLVGAAFGGGTIGGGIVWLGLAYLAGVRTKIADAMRLRSTAEGGPLEDDARVSVIGAIEPAGVALTSPFTGKPCVAYKYEVRNGDALLYYGIAVAPCAIDTQHGQIGVLAYPTLQVRPHIVPNFEAVPNFSEYMGRTDFHEAQGFHEALKAFNERNGSLRSDTRTTRGNAAVDRATFTEWSLAPGDRVYASGHYSMMRNALVPEPGMPLSLILRDDAGGFAGSSIAGAVGNFIGAAIFLGIAAAGLLGLYAFVPLAASEQMSPSLTPTWREVRLERLLDRRVRGRMREAGLLDSGTITAMLEGGTARGRVASGGRDVEVSRATLSHVGDMTIVRIDDDAVVLTLDRIHHPLRLRFGNEDVDASTFARDLQLDITNSTSTDVAGRFTYLRDDAPSPACRVTFHAR